MNKLCEQYHHSAQVQYDGDDSIVEFRWHWPRGTFDRRMSALEIAVFVMPHMPSILPLLSNHPRVHAEFAALLIRLATWPKQVLDEVLPWIRRLDYTEEDEILLLHLGAKELPVGPVHFVLGT